MSEPIDVNEVSKFIIEFEMRMILSIHLSNRLEKEVDPFDLVCAEGVRISKKKYKAFWLYKPDERVFLVDAHTKKNQIIVSEVKLVDQINLMEETNA